MSIQIDVITYEISVDFISENEIVVSLIDGISVYQNGVRKAIGVRALNFIDGTNTTAEVDQYEGKARVKFNSTASGGGGASAWGAITGTLSDQTDLQTALDAKQAVITFGTGVETALGVNIGSAGAPVLFNGALGTPSSATLTNATGLPIGGITGLGTGVGTWLATPSWTNFNSLITGTATYWSLANGGTLTAQNDLAMGGFNATFLNGNTLWGPTGATITANTRKDIRGIGTTTANILRLANSSNTARYTLNDQGDATLTGKMNILGTALGGSTTTENLLNVTGTMPTTGGVNPISAVLFQVAGAGSYSGSAVTNALRVDITAGFTGSSPIYAGNFINRSAGTGTTAPTMGASFGNGGNLGLSLGTTTGHNYGLVGQALGGNVSVGVIGQAQTSKNSATNIGSVSLARNSGTTPVEIGHLVGILADATALSSYVGTSAALRVTNGSSAIDIANFWDGTTAVVTIANGGLQTNTAGLNLSGASSPLQVGGSAGTSGQVLTSAGAGATPTWSALGTIAVVSPTAPDRTLAVNIAGTTYYLAAKTTND